MDFFRDAKDIEMAIRGLDLETIQRFSGKIPEVTLINWFLELLCGALMTRYTGLSREEHLEMFAHRGAVETAKDLFDAVLDLCSGAMDHLDFLPWILIRAAGSGLEETLQSARTISEVVDRQFDPDALDWSCFVCLSALPPCHVYEDEEEGTPLLYAVKHNLGPLTVQVLLERCDFSAAEWANGKALYYTTITEHTNTMQLVMTQRAQRVRPLINQSFSFGSSAFDASNVLAECCRLAPEEGVERRVDFLLSMGADPRCPGAIENLRRRGAMIVNRRTRQEFESTLAHLSMAAMSVR